MTEKRYSLWDADEWDNTLYWDHANNNITNLIKRDHVKVFRKAYIKRRQLSDGQFESDWVEVTKDVKRWGSINSNIDFQRVGKLAFTGAQLVMQNIEGKYNPDGVTGSLWEGFANQQRTLVKIECGFYHQWLGTDGVWRNETYPDDPTVFVGIVSGNISVSDQNEVTLDIRPLTQVFRDYPASFLGDFSTAGITASRFMEFIRDHTDGAGSFVFRPFFGDTTTNWEITSTSIVYGGLDSGSSSDILENTVWDTMEQLAESEQYIPYITPQGKFRWVPKDVGSTTSYEFYGLGITPNTEYGHTIKRVFGYGPKLTNFYSRVAVKYTREDTSSSFVNTALAFAINGTNTAWNLGVRTFSIQNFLIPNSTVAASVASSVFSQVSSLDEEINFSTSLIPHLNLLDRVEVSYDATDFSTLKTYWDISDWDSELTWDLSRGDAIVLNNESFKIISININLDNLETRFVARQLNL